MPDMYRCPYMQSSANRSEGLTYYRGFSGPGTVLGEKDGVSITTISNAVGKQTWLVVEAREPVPWTKPDDLPYDPGKPLPQLGAPGASTFNAILLDAQVQNYPVKTDEETMRKHIVWKRSR
jgi:hypothetical protein